MGLERPERGSNNRSRGTSHSTALVPAGVVCVEMCCSICVGATKH